MNKVERSKSWLTNLNSLMANSASGGGGGGGCPAQHQIGFSSQWWELLLLLLFQTNFVFVGTSLEHLSTKKFSDWTTGDWDYIWLKTCIPYHFCPWKPQDGIFSNFTLSPRYSRRKCKVGENAVLGLSKPELVRNACFYIELVSLTYDWTYHVCSKIREREGAWDPPPFHPSMGIE